MKGAKVMSSVDVRMKFSAEQLAALDGYRVMLYEKFGVKVSRSQAIRDMIGKQVRDAGMAWPDDPPLGGDRRSPKARGEKDE
jgi:hypothetical protein